MLDFMKEFTFDFSSILLHYLKHFLQPEFLSLNPKQIQIKNQYFDPVSICNNFIDGKGSFDFPIYKL